MKMLYSKIGRNIFIVDKYFRLFLKASLKSHDLNTAEGMVLLTLYGQNGQTSEQILRGIHHEDFSITQNQLIDDLHYDKGVMTRTMQSLEQKGFVQRADNPADSRSFVFYVTDKAFMFKPVLIGILRKWSDCILQDLDVAVLKVLDEALMEMAEKAASTFKEGDI